MYTMFQSRVKGWVKVHVSSTIDLKVKAKPSKGGSFSISSSIALHSYVYISN